MLAVSFTLCAQVGPDISQSTAMANKRIKCKQCKKFDDREGFKIDTPMLKICSSKCEADEKEERLQRAKDKAAKKKTREQAKIKLDDQKKHQNCLKEFRRNPKNEALIAAQLLARLEGADDNGYCTCVTCGYVGKWNDGFHGGHYIAKGNSSYWALDSRNIHPQCSECNTIGMTKTETVDKYTSFMVDKYGQEFVDHMEEMKRHLVERKDKDYNEYISAARVEIAAHKKRIGVS